MSDLKCPSCKAEITADVAECPNCHTALKWTEGVPCPGNQALPPGDGRRHHRAAGGDHRNRHPGRSLGNNKRRHLKCLRDFFIAIRSASYPLVMRIIACCEPYFASFPPEENRLPRGFQPLIASSFTFRSRSAGPNPSTTVYSIFLPKMSILTSLFGWVRNIGYKKSANLAFSL